MNENKNNDPKVDPKNNPDQKKEPTINKGSKNPDTDQQPTDKIDNEDEIENPDRNREHDDTDHEHDYKTPADNSFNQKSSTTQKKTNGK